jgi:sec-independent protein translocase protein TatA
MFEGLAQPMHLLVILCIALLVFGPGKLKDLGKGLGEIQLCRNPRLQRSGQR